MSCAARAEVDAPTEVEATPFEQALGAAVDEYDQAERLLAHRTATAEAVATAVAPMAASLRRLALSSLMQDRLAVNSPATEDGVKLMDVLPEVVFAAA